METIYRIESRATRIIGKWDDDSSNGCILVYHPTMWEGMKAWELFSSQTLRDYEDIMTECNRLTKYYGIVK